MVFELVDLGYRFGLPCGVGACRAHGGVGAREIQRGGFGSRCDDCPCLCQISRGDILGVFDARRTGIAHVGVMGLDPQNAFIGGGAFVIGAAGKLGGCLVDSLIQRAVAGVVVRDCHILRVFADVCIGSRAVEDFAVAENVAGICLDSVDDRRPEVAAAVFIVGKLDVLCRVKTEAVNAAVDTILHQIQHHPLNIVVSGVEVGHAEMVLGDVIAAVAVGVFVVVVEIIAVLKIFIHTAVQVFVGAAVGAVVGEVVGDDINDDLDAVPVGFGAELRQLLFGAEPRVAVGNRHSERLIELPPLTAAVCPRGIVILGSLNRRGLNRGIARRGDVGQVCLDAVVRPVKAVQNGAALNGFLRVGYNGFRFGGSRDRADRYNRSNHAQRKKDACQFFGETHRITP